MASINLPGGASLGPNREAIAAHLKKEKERKEKAAADAAAKRNRQKQKSL